MHNHMLLLSGELRNDKTRIDGSVYHDKALDKFPPCYHLLLDMEQDPIYQTRS